MQIEFGIASILWKQYMCLYTFEQDRICMCTYISISTQDLSTLTCIIYAYILTQLASQEDWLVWCSVNFIVLVWLAEGARTIRSFLFIYNELSFENGISFLWVNKSGHTHTHVCVYVQKQACIWTFLPLKIIQISIYATGRKETLRKNTNVTHNTAVNMRKL